ncbi:MAG: cadherin-like beta sandwich domain-containing protein [Verrucomicrobiaceae bacterium]|nr:cadherin-like beta sandwich domain-containing protein [Verrucomicrobiaceae bacterium]
MRKVVFLFCAVVLTAFFVFWPQTAPKAVSMAEPAAQSVLTQKPALLSAPTKAFTAWFSDYSANPSPESLELGKAYAKQHTAEIAKLIVSDPQLAIESAVPMVVRQKLPKEIVALLEDRVRVRGDYEVYGNAPLPGQEATMEPYTRTVTTEDGKRWNAHVYGKRQWQRSTSNASLNGVAVGREMAVSDSPLRVLEVGEVPQGEGREVVEACPISGIETEVEKAPDGSLAAVSEETPAFETPERVIYVCSGGHITQISEQYLSDEEKAHWEQLGTELNAGTGSGPANAPISGTIPSGWTTGNRTFLYIRACFPDNPVDPQNEQECYDMFKAANDYIVQTSYGRCYLTYAFPPLVVLPYPLEWYNRYNTDVGGGDYLVQNHAIQIAKSMGYNNGSYNMWAVRWSGGPGSYGGSASVGGAGMRMKSSSSGTFLHELGHNLGVWHANYWRTTPPSVTGPGNNAEYGNTFDVMGSSGSSGQYTASFKNTLSWMPPEQYWNVTSSGLYRISQTDASIADPSLRYALRLRRDAERDFWAEFRLRHTTNVGFTNGLMMTFDQWGLGGIGGSGGAPLNGSNRGAQLLDMTPGSFGNGITDTRNDSALWMGRTFSDPDFNIHFTPVANNTTTVPPSMDVQVQIGDAPGNNAPTLSIAASATSVGTGVGVTFTATASDPDSDTLAYAWVFDDGNYSLNNSAVQTKSWGTAGHYQVLCTASDMKGKRTTKSILITVGTPSTFTVSGTITGTDSLPLEGVYVANYAPSNNTTHTNSATFRGTWTDSDGNYTLTRLAAGSYSISPGLYPLVFTPDGFANPLTVGPSTTAKNFTSASLPAVTISYPDDVAAEGAVANPATIRLSREGSAAADLSVQIYNVNTGSATRNTDYTLAPAPATATSPDGGSGTSQYIIPAGAAFLDITLTPVQDTTAEGVEYASLDFVNTAHGYIMAGNPKAVVAITDDENNLPVVKITPVDDSGHEAGTDTLTMLLERTGVTAAALNVSLSYTGTATRNTDYTAAASVSIPAGSSSTTFTITPINDSDIETTETIICTVASNAAYNRNGTAQAVTSTLNDDDMPTVSIVATDAAASETGNDKGVFTITRTGSTAAALIVDYGVNGRAVLGSDYRRLEGRATIPVGLASTTVEIIPFDDALDEGTQDVILQLRTTREYFINPATQSATLSITDNDASQMYVELDTGSGTEPASGSAAGAVFNIRRPASGAAITVNYTITGTATSGTDFTALPGTIAFAAADTSKTITVSMLADTALEDAESVVLTLTTGTGYSPLAGQFQSATAWIYDADQPTVEVNVGDGTSGLTAPFTESTTVTTEDFFISRRGSTTADLVVNYTMSGTATEGVDYTALSGTATIPAGSTGVYVNVAAIVDTVPEGTESIIMTLTSGSYGVRVGSATMLLGDNDSFSSMSVGFAAATATTNEAVGTYNLAVNRSGTSTGTASVQYRVNGGSAAGNGIDFSLANGVLNFASGETSKTIPITIVQDQLPEPAETIIVQLLNQTGANLGTSSHTLTVNNISMPEAFSDPATAVIATGATLNGRVMPGGLATSYWFQYGLTPSYGQVTPTQNLAAGSAITAVTAALSGNPLTTYHYRLVVQNAQGTTSGINQTFTTSSAIHFDTPTTVPIVSNEFSASGSPLITLGFTPTAGQVLKLVDNTGFLLVSGIFANKPEGSLLTALEGATPRTFEISYSGGDGNDITLTAVSEVITFEAIGVKYVGDPAFTLNATSSGASAVSYEIVAGAASASVSGNTVTLTSTPGTVTIKATAGTALPKYQTFVLAAANTGFAQISASKAVEWALGIRANGTLWGWGINTYGMIGDGSLSTRRTPVQVGIVATWRQVSCGTDHALGTRTDGTLWAWGRNNNGQIGQGSTTTTQYTSPTQIGTETTWAWVVAGANHCVAVKTDGTLWAWGANGNGQVGQGNTTTTIYSTPTQIGTLTTWSTDGDHLHAGGDFTLALRANGTLWAWGQNTNSQLGDASTTLRSAPVQIGSVTSWSRVMAGTAFSAALRTDGSLWTWGANGSGQLGDGSLTTSNAPTQLGSVTTWSKIIAGASHMLATRSDGTLWSWGANVFGQLGQGIIDPTARGNTPQQIGTAVNWQEVAAGTNFSLATTTDSALRAWGSNNSGQNGFLPRLMRPLAANLGAVSSAVGANAVSYFLREDGSLWSVGSNSIGQLGISSSDSSPHHTPVRLASGPWRQISGGNSNLLAIRQDGTLWGLGFNTSGQLGDGATANHSFLFQVGTDDDWQQVSAGNTHSLAVKADGTLWAWGANGNGQLGNNSTTASTVPVQVGSDTDWEQAYTSYGTFSVAKKTNGTLWDWGVNTNGQVGQNDTTQRLVPTQIGTFTDWTRVAVGNSQVLALRSNGTLWGWGINSNNQLGDGTTSQRNAPVQIGTATNWKSINTSTFHSSATRTDGTLWTWGANGVGYLATGTYSSRSTPGQVGTATCWDVVMPTSGSAFTQVRAVDGSLWAAGWNNLGQNILADRSQLTPEVIFPALTAAQTLSFTAPSTVPVGDTITLNATASSALPARYIVTGPASLNGDKLTINAAGLVTVIAYQPGDSYWQASDLRYAYINLAAPTATTLASTSVGTTTATLNATVNPNGSVTTALFQSGTSISYGTNSPITLTAPSGVTAENVSLELTGLLPGTTYHFRVSASNLGGTDNGDDLTFTTLSNNADLSALAMSTGTLSPAFASSTLSYTASVTASTTSVSLTATTANTNATLQYRVNGSEYTTTNGLAIPVTLVTGLNTVQIEVTAEDEVTLRLYTLQITRPSGYSVWSAATGITGATNADPMDDFDGDGIANVLEYAMGMAGASASGTGALVLTGSTLNATGQPIVRQLPPPGGGAPEWCAIFIRRKDYVQAGLTYTPNFSADLSAWQTSATTPTVLADDGTYEAVCIPHPVIGAGPAKFFKLGVTLAP